MSAVAITTARSRPHVLSDRQPPALIFAIAIGFLPLLRPGFQSGNLSLVDVFVVASVFAAFVWLAETGQELRMPLVTGWLVYVVAGGFASAIGQYPMAGAIAVAQDVILFVWAIALANVCRTPRALAIVVRTWVVTSIAWASVLIVAVAAGISGLAGQDVEGGRAGLTFVSPNQAGNYFAISLMLLLATGYPRRRLVRWASVAILAGALILAASNAALGGVAAGCVVAAVIRIARAQGRAAGILAAVVAIVLTSGLAFTVKETQILDTARYSSNIYIRNTIGRSERSAEDRLLRIDQLRELYDEGGPLGFGAASTEDVLVERGFANAKSAHNDYIASLVERGVLGTLGLVIFAGSLAFMGAGIAVRPLAPPFRRVIIEPGFLVGALVVVAAAGLSHEVLHFRHVWAMFGIVAAVWLWSRSPSSAVTSP